MTNKEIFDIFVAKGEDFHLKEWKPMKIMTSVELMGDMPEIKVDFVPGKAQLSIFLCDTTVKQILEWINIKLKKELEKSEGEVND